MRRRGREEKRGTWKLAMCERTGWLIVVNQLLTRASRPLARRAPRVFRTGTICRPRRETHSSPRHRIGVGSTASLWRWTIQRLSLTEIATIAASAIWRGCSRPPRFVHRQHLRGVGVSPRLAGIDIGKSIGLSPAQSPRPRTRALLPRIQAQ